MGLSLVLPNVFTFDDFIVGNNAQVITRLRHGSTIWLYGESAVGKTHLLHALCGSCESAIFVDSPETDLSGCESFELIAIDNVTDYFGKYETELKLQTFYQSLDFEKNRLVVASRHHSQEIQFALNDLASRLRSFQALFLEPLPAGEKVGFLIHCAKRRGIVIAENVAEYIVDRTERSQSALLEFLDELDRAAFEQGRQVTIPFVRSLLHDE